MRSKLFKKWSTNIKVVDSRKSEFRQEIIWNVLTNIKRSEDWWPKNLRYKVLNSTENIEGSEFRIWPYFGKPFQGRFIKLIPLSIILVEYFGDYITGKGEWVLEPFESGTLISYKLDVKAHGLLVSILGKFLPLDKFHSQPMNGVFDNLEIECRRSIKLETKDHLA